MEQVITVNLAQCLAFLGLPSAIVGFAFWFLERKIEKREKALMEREAAREQHMVYIVKIMDANNTLIEATAKAVQRIPDARCNGDMHRALEEAERLKTEGRDWLNKQAIKAIY